MSAPGPAPDQVAGVDWAAHWRGLVEARSEQVGGARPAAFWDRRAVSYGSAEDGPDPFLDLLAPFLGPGKTVIDVGAGTGRQTAPLTSLVDWVTAVEPSQGMRERIPEAPNLTLVASAWEDAEVAPADLVVCCHVLYSVAEAVPFLEKLEERARERVFVELRDAQLRHPAELLWEAFTGLRRARQPQLWDLYNLLRWMGVEPDLAAFMRPARQRFESLERALEDCRLRVGEPWREAEARLWLESHLAPGPGGGVVFEAPDVPSGVAHWKPRRT